ncbi:MAG: DNRLRE domain-containing protein, partial [Deltaproteobacteria bacterium]
VRITAPANGSAFFAANGPIGFSGSATDVEDGNISGRVQWSSDRDGALASGANITASQLSIGTHTITAMAIDDDGLHGQASISIRVRGPNEAPHLTITSPADGTSVPAGTPTALIAAVTDDFDTNLEGQVRWSSDRDGQLGSGPRTVTLTEGSHTLTATVTDSDGATSTAQARVIIAPSAPVVTITSPPAGTRVFAGTTVTFSGTATDATDGNLTSALRWTSDRDGTIGSGPSFSTSHLSIGTHTITAAAADRGSLVGQTQVTLVIRGPNVPPVVNIIKPDDGGALLAGKAVLLSGEASDAEDGDLSATIRWTSSLDGALGTGQLLLVPSLSLGTHTLTAVVTDRDGATATSTVTVAIRPSTVTLSAIADTYVDASVATTKLGTQTGLWILGSPVKQTFLRFSVSGIGSLAVQSAHLKLTASSLMTATSTSGGALHSITDNTWAEATTTYNNRPAVDGPTLGTQGAVALKQVIDFDVSTAVRGDGTYNFGLVATTGKVAYNSREATSGQPALVLTLAQNQTPAITITAPASGTKAHPGDAVTFTGRALDAENGDLSSQIQWRSNIDGLLGTGASLTYSMLSPGMHTISARVTDASGLAAEAHITIVVAHPPMVGIAAPADGSVYYVTDLPVSLAGQATDVEDGDLSANIQWRSDLAGPLGSGAAISAGGLAIGRHTITASVTDADGLMGEAQIQIRVRGPNAAPQITITAPRDGAATPAGTMVQLAAAAIDDFDGDISSRVRWTSDRDGALFTGASRSLLLSEGSHVLTATITDTDRASASAQVHVTITPTAPVVSITAPPTGTRVFAGTSVPFGATAIDSTDGNVGATLRWISNLDGPIGTSPSFSTTRLSTGTHTITAVSNDTGGLLGRAQTTVVIRPLNVTPVVTIISPADQAALLVGKPVVLGATALDAEDGDLSPTIRWTSSRDGALGTGPTVLRSSLSAGTHTITATVTDLDGATGTATVTVNVVPATITFSPVADTYVDSGAATKVFGTGTIMQAASSPVRQAFLRFQVTGVAPLKVQQALVRLTVGSASTDASAVGGTLRAITNNTWSEATTTYNTRPAVDGAVLTTKGKVLTKQVVDFDATTAVTGDGTYNFAMVSSSTDWVSYQTREATSGKPQLVLTLAQSTAPVVNIAAPAPNATVNIGAPVTFAGTATDAESGDLSSQIQWTSNLDGVLGTGASIIVPHLQPGTHVITARVTDSTGLSGQARITLNVGHKPNVAISAPQNHSVFYVAQGPIGFIGTASDFEDGNLSGRIQWNSDRDGTLGTGSSISRTLSIGTHTVTATVTDINGNVGQAQVIVRVRGPNVAPALTVTAPQDNSSAPADTDVTLTAVANDDFDGNISSQVQWTSSRQGALFVGASKAVRLREGQHTITASVTDSDGATSTAQITVIITPTPPALTITSPAAGSTVTQDASTSFNVTALDATDGDLSSTVQWTSDRDGVLASGATFATNMLSEGTHRITATVTDTGGLVGSATITLTVIRIPAVVILLPQQSDGFLAGNMATFFATATDRVDGDVAASLVWTSDRDGQIGTGTSFTTSSLSMGTHTITAKATNSAHNDGAAQVSVVVHVASFTFDPIADTYGDEFFPTTKFGASTELDVGSTSPTRKASFLRFAVTGIGSFPIIDTQLQMTVGSSSTASGGAGGQVNSLTTAWSESATTWNTRPVIDGPVLASNSLPVVQGQHVTFDLGATAVTGDGTYNFALTSSSSDAAKYESRESLIAANRPHLVVMLGQPATRRLPQLTITAPAAGSSAFDDQAVTFTATARDDRDGDLTGVIIWRSSVDGALGTGGSVTAASLHRGVHTITATVRNSTGLTGVATLQLTASDRPPAVTIKAPQDGRLFPIHFAASFTATATDNVDGDVAPLLVWTSDRDGRIGTGRSISTSTLSTGDHRITASVTNSLGTTGTASITVTVGNGAPRITVTAPADGSGVDEGTTVTLTATATDAEDGDLTSAIAWASDLQGALGAGGTVSVRLTVVGTHHITATAADSGGQTRAASITVTVYAAPPVLTIVAPADGFSTSGSVTFSGTALDFKDGDRSNTIRWSSNVAGSLGTGATVTAARLAAGRHVITASVTDSDNLTSTKTITIGVGNAPPRVTITQPADGATAAAGTPITFQATALDGIDGTLTARIQWVSDLNGMIGTGGSITTSTLARGTHVITAQVADSSGLTGSAFVIVTITPGSTSNNRAPQVTIAAPASGAQIPVGSAVTFTGSAIDEAGDISANLAWVSSLDGVIGTGRSFSTSALSAGTHRIVASVSDSAGAVGSAAIAITVSGGGISFPAAADAYTDGGTASQSTNFGTATFLRLFNQPVDRIYLRFTVSGLPPGPVARAIVRMTTTSATNSGSDSGGEIHTVSTAWDELTINHLNKPSPDAAILSSVAGPIVPSQTVDYDVSAAVTGNGTYDFVVKTLSIDRAEFVSREGGTGAPQLIIFRDAPTATNPTVHITSPTDGTMVSAGTSTTFTATATDPQDGNIASTLTWRSDRDGVLGTGPSVSATLSLGPHIITATARDSMGATAADLIHVTVGNGAPAVTIAAPANTSSAVFGQPVAFIGSATDMPDGDLSFNLQWTSSIDGPIGTGPSFITRLSAGTHTITASVTDSDHNTGSASITFQVTATRVGYEDFSYGPSIEVQLDKATATKAQSKLWFVDGVWWGVLFNAPKSEYHIYRMDLATQTWIDTGVAVDDRGKSRADTMWDAPTGKLYVVSRFGFSVTPAQNRLYRYTYFPGAQTWALDDG